MSTYAIGDIQGCLDPLQRLLKRLNFRTDRDQLWLTGDLVNRGPDSLETLRFLHARRDNLISVLGNHDLHLLAIAHGGSALKKADTLADILAAPDRSTLLGWLLNLPLLHHDAALDAVLVHAGIPPCWDLAQAQTEAQAVATALETDPAGFFRAMYGNEPALWSPALSGNDRLRYAVNALTRMRLLTPDGALDLKSKDTPEAGPPGHLPWFRYRPRRPVSARIVFGHWAALNGETDDARLVGLDTGCVWGNRLTAMDLDSGERCSVPA